MGAAEMNELRELVRVANAALRENGVRIRERERDGHVEYALRIPTRPRALVISARVALPGDEVGKLFGKNSKFRNAAKKVAKKVAKSKVFKKLAKIAPMLAMVVPGGQAIAAGVAAVAAAKKIASAAKRGNPKAKAFAKAAAKKATANVQAARSVQVAAPGYPQQYASEQPQPQPAGNYGAAPPPNYGDADPSEMEDAMDPDFGSDGEVLDASEEQVPDDFGGPDSDWPEDDFADSDAAE